MAAVTVSTSTTISAVVVVVVVVVANKEILTTIVRLCVRVTLHNSLAFAAESSNRCGTYRLSGQPTDRPTDHWLMMQRHDAALWLLFTALFTCCLVAVAAGCRALF